MERKKIIDEISDLLDKERSDNYSLMSDFFNLLFWKNYGGHHVDINDMRNIQKEIKEATKIDTYDGDENVRLDLEKILPFINKIRKQIGLKGLTNKLFGGGLAEMTPEVKKELMLKELE